MTGAAARSAYGGEFPWSRADTVACVVLFIVTVWYCASAPYNLYVYDEGYFLYEAKRIVDGEVFYRDFFNIVTPLAWYVIAAAYWLFGVSMATARTTMAVVHGIIAICMVVACRTLNVRTGIAAAVGLSEAAVCYMATERAAPHWFGTLFCVWILLALLRHPLTNTRNALLTGVLVGGLALTQQQRGVAMVWVPFVVVAADVWLLVPRADRSWRRIIAHAASCAVGMALVVVPVMLLFVIVAGFDNVWTALVRYPLVNYRGVHSASWGAYNPVQDPYIGPVIKYASLLVPAMYVVGCAWGWRRAANSAALRKRLVVLLTSVGALLGVTYVPGYGYLVLVGPVWFILIADLVEAALRAAEHRAPRARIASAVATVGCILLLGMRLVNRRYELHTQWRYEGDTPFGKMAFANEWDAEVLQALERIVAETPGRELFIYPTAPGLYLLTGANNVTRFQIFVPGYTSPEHVQEVLDTLEQRRFPFVVRNWIWMDNKQDPLLPYLSEKYEKVALPFPPKQMRTITLFRRKPDRAEPKGF